MRRASMIGHRTKQFVHLRPFVPQEREEDRQAMNLFLSRTKAQEHRLTVTYFLNKQARELRRPPLHVSGYDDHIMIR